MPLDLGESLTLINVRTVKEALLEGLKQDQPLTLDASSLREIDVAGLQLLCATRRFAMAHGKSVTHASPPHAALAAIAAGAGFGCAPDCLCAGGPR